jgi:hypothetical protein
MSIKTDKPIIYHVHSSWVKMFLHIQTIYQGVLVFKWITLVTSVSQGDLWFSYNFHIDIIYLVVAIYKIRQPLNIWKYEANKNK